MRKLCLLKQPAGLGDIFFTQKIVDDILSKGYEVIWPVISEYLWVKDHINKKNLFFVDENDDFPYKNVYTENVVNFLTQDNFLYIPMMFADRYFPTEKIMVSKYKLCDLSHQNWQASLVFSRNEDKEDKLFRDILGLKEQEKYILYNQEYGPPSNTQKYEINKMPENVKKISITPTEGFTLFDWCKTIENASELHIAHTSMQYIMENLNLKASVLKSYAYGGQKQHDQVASLFTEKKWDWVIND